MIRVTGTVTRSGRINLASTVAAAPRTPTTAAITAITQPSGFDKRNISPLHARLRVWVGRWAATRGTGSAPVRWDNRAVIDYAGNGEVQGASTGEANRCV